MSNHPKCENCIHWSAETNWLGNFKTEACNGLRKYISAGANWIADETSIETPHDFYCTLHERKEKWSFGPPPKVGED